jgi:hypothetical protein
MGRASPSRGSPCPGLGALGLSGISEEPDVVPRPRPCPRTGVRTVGRYIKQLAESFAIKQHNDLLSFLTRLPITVKNSPREPMSVIKSGLPRKGSQVSCQTNIQIISSLEDSFCCAFRQYAQHHRPFYEIAHISDKPDGAKVLPANANPSIIGRAPVANENQGARSLLVGDPCGVSTEDDQKQNTTGPRCQRRFTNIC